MYICGGSDAVVSALERPAIERLAHLERLQLRVDKRGRQ